MSHNHTPGVVFLAILATVAVACAHNEEVDGSTASSTGWSCGSSEVPMGSVVRCTQGALLVDSSLPISESCTGSTDNPDPGACSTYECDSGTTDCPSSTTTTTPTTTTTTDTSGSTSSGADSVEECNWDVGLPYCTGSSTGSTTTTTTPAPCDKANCDAPGQTKEAPGQTKKDESPSGSGANGKKESTHYKCVKDKHGNKACESVPNCAAGTHPSTCGACVVDGDTSDCVPQAEGGCWVTGGGFIVAPNDVTGAAADGHDNFGGNAKPMKDGRIQGHWNHVDHGTMNHAKGKPEYIVCRHVDEPGPGQPGGKKGFTMNQVYFGGHAEWREHEDGAWQSGYWFDVVAKDHGEPGSVPKAKNGFMPDTYHFTIRKMDDPAAKVSGAKVYETHGTLEGGNIQLHPPNGGHPYTPMSLPGWVSWEP